jgi:STE24 endopeptidase
VTEDKATRYHRLKRRSEVLALLWSAVCFSGLLLSGASRFLGELAVSLSAGWPLLSVVWMVAALLLVHEAGALPLAWYGGYVLERRYELTRQGPGAWVGDHVKGALLGLALASVAAVIVYGSMHRFGGSWWLVAGGVIAVLIAGLATVAPILLLPLFFRFRPLARPELVSRLQQLASDAGTRVMGVYEWALSAKSRKANAALTGIGSTRRIIVSDTMLEQYADDEIAVVLAHELGHHVHHDIWRAMVFEFLLILLGFYATDAALRAFGPALGLVAIDDIAGLPLLVLTAGAVSLALTPLALALSRLHERRADRFALDLTGSAVAFTTAMRRLGAQNLAEERPSRLVRWLFYSHPPIEERIAAARRWEEEEGLGRRA